ncbi:MAG: hypothetical protein HZA00_09935 [Nitrospinae bacterium]|nr:hypothetical protein [Nitrospinota bacterium]
MQYLKARVSNDLNTLYFFQHPEYKVIIDIDKFKSSGGEIQLDYSSITEQNPVPHVYIIPHQFPASVKDFRIEKCFIGKEGRYAKFNAIIVMNLFLPFVRGPVEREARNIEYWEKVNGEWFVLNKVRPNPSHISGAVTATPINLPEEKAEYIEVDTRLVTSDL